MDACAHMPVLPVYDHCPCEIPGTLVVFKSLVAALKSFSWEGESHDSCNPLPPGVCSCRCDFRPPGERSQAVALIHGGSGSG